MQEQMAGVENAGPENGGPNCRGAFSGPAFSTPVIRFSIFISCIFHPCYLVLEFQVLHFHPCHLVIHFQVLHFQRPPKSKTKIGTTVGHVTRDSAPLSRSKGQNQLAGGGAYCGGLPHNLFYNNDFRNRP